MSKIYSYFHVHAPFDPDHHFSTSWLVSPLHLAVFRLVIALYGVIGIIVKLLLTGQDKTAGASFSYFSNITYWGLTFYFLFAGLHSLSCSLRGRAWLELWPKWLQLLHGLLYSTIVTFPFLVTIVFWSVQFRPETLHGQLNAWSTISRHALNSVYALFEAVVPRTEMPPWMYVLPSSMYGCADVASVIYHAFSCCSADIPVSHTSPISQRDSTHMASLTRKSILRQRLQIIY